MLKTVAVICCVLAIGPVLAVLTLMGGCFGRHPLFGVMCGDNAPVTLLLSTVFWFSVVGLVMFLVRGRIGNQRLSALGADSGRRVRSSGHRHKVGKAR
jgi:hypothetical protein